MHYNILLYFQQQLPLSNSEMLKKEIFTMVHVQDNESGRIHISVWKITGTEKKEKEQMTTNAGWISCFNI